MSWFVYILKCRNGSLYTGVTTDLQRRLREHQQGSASRFTRSQLPVKLVYHEDGMTERRAKRREAELQSWSRGQKLALIRAA